MTAFREHIESAIDRYGSQTKLAQEVGCSQQYISWLLTEAEQVSAEMSLAFERAGLSRSDLRPDLFPRSAPAEPGRA